MARVQFGELRSIKLRIFVTIENNEINKKCSYLCEILLDLRKKMRFEMHHEIYLPAGHC